MVLQIRNNFNLNTVRARVHSVAGDKVFIHFEGFKRDAVDVIRIKSLEDFHRSLAGEDAVCEEACDHLIGLDGSARIQVEQVEKAGVAVVGA